MYRINKKVHVLVHWKKGENQSVLLQFRKDMFDICYLSDMVDMEKFRFCIQKYIYVDTTIGINDADEIRKRFVKKKYLTHSYI